jgi:hypothetical protein
MKAQSAVALVLVLLTSAAVQPSSVSAAPSPRRRDKFNLSLVVRGSRDSNPLFVQSTADPQFIGDAGAHLEYRQGWKRSVFSLGAQGSAQRYSDRSDLGHFDYGGQAAFDVRLSRRMSLSGSQTYVSAYTRDIPAFAEAGLVLPLVVAHRAESTVRLERLGSRWQPTVEAHYGRADFPSGALEAGTELAITPSLWRKLGRVHALGAAYVFERASRGAFDGDVHGGLVGITRQKAKGLGYRLEAGAAYVPRTRKSTAIGIAELSLTRRKDRVAAHYGRGIQEAYGLSRQVFTDLVSLSLSREVVRRLSLAASGAVGINTDPADRTFRYRSDTYTGALQWAVTKDLSAGAGWSYWRSTFAKDVVTPSSRGWVSLGYRLGW